LELRLLKYFLAIANEGTISQAAEVLNITQPTLSRQLKELEEDLEVTLFTRSGRKMILTDAGFLLKSRAEEILSLTAQTEEEFRNHKNELLSGQLLIGCVEADNSDTLAMMLEEFISDYPQVSFHLYSGTSDDISEKLDKGLLDLAILLEPINTEKYFSLQLPRSERWGLLVSKNFFLAQKEKIIPDDLSGVPLLISQRIEIQKMLAEWMGEPLEELTIVGTFNLIFNTFSLIENQVGSALAIEGAVLNRMSESTRFVLLEPEIKTNCVLVWRKNRVISPLVKQFIDTCYYAFKA
jgi:DNA-binding transcriptional LysR family regulator